MCCSLCNFLIDFCSKLHSSFSKMKIVSLSLHLMSMRLQFYPLVNLVTLSLFCNHFKMSALPIKKRLTFFQTKSRHITRSVNGQKKGTIVYEKHIPFINPDPLNFKCFLQQPNFFWFHSHDVPSLLCLSNFQRNVSLLFILSIQGGYFSKQKPMLKIMKT